jgi:hypothetical protein
MCARDQTLYLLSIAVHRSMIRLHMHAPARYPTGHHVICGWFSRRDLRMISRTLTWRFNLTRCRFQWLFGLARELRSGQGAPLLCLNSCTEEELKRHHGVRELCGSLSTAFPWPASRRQLAGGSPSARATATCSCREPPQRHPLPVDLPRSMVAVAVASSPPPRRRGRRPAHRVADRGGTVDNPGQTLIAATSDSDTPSQCMRRLQPRNIYRVASLFGHGVGTGERPCDWNSCTISFSRGTTGRIKFIRSDWPLPVPLQRSRQIRCLNCHSV